VHVEVEAAAEALREADGAATRPRDAERRGALLLAAQDLAHEEAPDRRHTPLTLTAIIVRTVEEGMLARGGLPA
jgi:hypothetical protein